MAHLLGNNFNLSKSILMSNYKKLIQNNDTFLMMDAVFKEQTNNGIIEKVENLNDFIAEHPEHSFLPRMGIFKMDRSTSKCRVVYLSNLCEASGKDKLS